LELVRHAGKIGAHGISSLPPRPPAGTNEICDWYRAIAAVSELPFLVYYCPEVNPALNNPVQLLEQVKSTNVVGLKFTDFNLFELWKLQTEGHVVFNGKDEVLAAGLLMGASGGIGSFYNLMPELFVKIWDAGRRGQWQEARSIQNQINEFIRIVIQFPVFASIKRLLAWSGLDCGRTFPVYGDLTLDQEAQLRRSLENSTITGALLRPLKIA
jgi:N-acetylneuraminate lyase